MTEEVNDIVDEVLQDDAENLPEEHEEPAENEEVEDDNPPGWKSYDEYINDGGDPDMYRGKEAFKQYHEFKQQQRSRADEKIDKVHAQMEELIKQQTEARRIEQEQHKAELAKALARAKEDLDVDAVQKITSEISNLDPVEEAPSQTGEAQWISDFRIQNPALNPEAEEYDPILETTVETAYNRVVQAKAARGEPINEAALQSLLKTTYDRVNARLNPVKPRARAPQVGSPNKKPKQANSAAQLTGTSKETYNYLLKNVGQTAAENFARNMTNG